MKKYIFIVMALLSLTINAQEKKEKETKEGEIAKLRGDRPDGHAPISVMGDHTHAKGEWMFSYRFMQMNMSDLINGKDEISNTEGHDAGYMVVPKEMPMNMHMFGVMYAPTDRLTLMFMANVIENDMDLQMRNMISGMIMPFSTSSNGFGDLKIAGLYKLFNKNKQAMHAELGFSIPTGSIEEKDVTAMSSGEDVILPYPMQIGSGTFDTTFGLTYLGQNETISWGNQLKGELRFGKNDNDYRLGNKYRLNNWLAVKANKWLSFSARVEGLIVNEIEGANPDLNPMMVTTANTDNSGGTYINSGLGFNTYVPSGKLKNLRLGFEYDFLLYQKANGIQLKQKETITIGLQYSFK